MTLISLSTSECCSTCYVSFGIGSTLVVASLYYCQPILIQLSASFHVTYDEVARIPTLVQAGFGIGLLFLTPLGDMFRRRQLILLLVMLSTTFTIGLAITNNFLVFEFISFLIGLASVTPQIFSYTSPPHVGHFLARVAAGVIGNFTNWHVIHYMSIGLQCFDPCSNTTQLSMVICFRSKLIEAGLIDIIPYCRVIVGSNMLTDCQVILVAFCGAQTPRRFLGIFVNVVSCPDTVPMLSIRHN
ncbi:hypothetical protein EDB19DRAFT_134162 [Suillus lakei]|nr:hypothetical protein EDB19DRAFT_134162 [Suillus lakei]